MLAAAAAGAAVHTSSLVLSGTSYHAPRGGGLSDPREIAERLSSANTATSRGPHHHGVSYGTRYERVMMNG